jgi:hypothetical protein
VGDQLLLDQRRLQVERPRHPHRLRDVGESASTDGTPIVCSM